MNRALIFRGFAVAMNSLAFALIVGCHGSALNPKTDLELRLDAANQETVTTDRDKSLATIATDAAEEGEVKTVNAALATIYDPKLRDATAAECAVRLVKAGDRRNANVLALTIKDPVARNDTLRRLADSDVGSPDPAARSTPPLGH